jgi:hypothetical protein
LCAEFHFRCHETGAAFAFIYEEVPVPWIPCLQPELAQSGIPADAPLRRPGLFLDETVMVGDAEAIGRLRHLGWDVRSSDEMGMLGWADDRVYAAAALERRALVTRDNLYFGNQRYPLESCPGLVVVRGEDSGAIVLVETLEFIEAVLELADVTWVGTKIEVGPDGTMRMIRAGWGREGDTVVERRFKRVDGAVCEWSE